MSRRGLGTGHELTLTACSRNTVGYVGLLDAADRANPDGDLYLVSDNLSGHQSPPVLEWLEAHPRVHPIFLPKGSCWLTLQEGWWRLFRREAFAGQTFADAEEIDQVIARSRGSGAALPVHTDTCVTVWCTAFEEWSTIGILLNADRVGVRQGSKLRMVRLKLPDCQLWHVLFATLGSSPAC